MSVRCLHCGAIAGYGSEVGHKSNCPALPNIRRVLRDPPPARTTEEDAEFLRMLTMPVDDDRDHDEMDKALEAAEKNIEKGGFPS